MCIRDRYMGVILIMESRLAGAEFNFKPEVHLKGHRGIVYVVKFDKDGNYCLSGSADKAINLWNPHKGTLIKSYSGIHNQEILDLAITQDNGKFASVGGDRLVYVWDVATAKVLRKFTGHTARINAVAFNQDTSISGILNPTLFVQLRKSRSSRIA
eukprot:TRINITY_DN9688_c0_g1_i2.p1 TRINITY_DN9688_c0_g1~~TRINITY_DN9688_c0_g1_i2.p1  ORF type:complete len:156 (-),score=28.41 TRINITY_DN9688_c0_g1_i2:473-940(-)